MLVVVAARWSWRSSPLLTAVCLPLLVDRLLFYGAWLAWDGGLTWGPRYLVPAMPALAPFVLEVVRRLPTVSQARVAALAGTVALVAVSLGVQIVGSTTNPAESRLMAEVNRRERVVSLTDPQYRLHPFTLEMLAAWDEPMYDWSLSPVADQAGQLVGGDHLSGRMLNPQVRGKRLAAAGVVVVLCGAAALRLPRRRDSDGADAAPRTVASAPSA